MKLEISATAVKSWFQYRCERKLVYDSMLRASRQALPIEENLLASPWAELGNEFERQVVEELKRRHPEEVLAPSGGQERLSQQMTLSFLGGNLPKRFAHQSVLKETPSLRRMLALPDGISIRSAHPDLLQVEVVDGIPTFHIIDVKATQVSTVFHKAQVAFYALMLRYTLKDMGFSGEPALTGRIWHMPAPSQPGLWVEQPFPLRGYEAFVLDFFRRSVPRLQDLEVSRERDNTFFHLYFKCEQCPYLPHCRRAISAPLPTERWDVSAVPGLSHESKRVLNGMGIRSVGQLARAAGVSTNPQGVNWSLKAQGPAVVARARSLQDGIVQRLPERRTWLMPARVDVAIHLVTDKDPMEGNLVTLGCLVVRDGRAESTIAVIQRGEDERQALKTVLSRVIEVLTEIDVWNAVHDEHEGLHAHLFLYEPSEGRDLQEALGRHLEDPSIRAGLLHLVRMFPPDQVKAMEPEYRGMHHLPATALKGVVEQLYALPVVVANDLEGVTRALAQAQPFLTRPYVPAQGFERHFSSRLSINIVRELRAGQRGPEAIRVDVASRLMALDALMRWILADHMRSGGQLLLLRKRPFRFQAQFDPLNATDLEILMAHELLENRSALMTTLTELARPADERRDRFRCFAHMRLDGAYPAGRDYRLRFFVPPESRQAELSSSTLGLILTNDESDLRLDPNRWRDLKVRLSSDLESGQHVEVLMNRHRYDAAGFQRLRRETPRDGWFLDSIHVDFNTKRAVDFLRSLAETD